MFRIPFAVLLVTDAPTQPHPRHTIVTEHGVWTRIDTGVRGRGNSFVKTSPVFDTDEEALGQPVAVILTPNDWEGWVTSQSISSIAQKLKVAFTNEANETPSGDAATALAGIQSMFQSTSADEIAKLVTDKRRKAGSMPTTTPTISAPRQVQVIPTQSVAPTVVSTPDSLMSVPDISKHKAYISRKVTGGMTDYEFLDKAFALQWNVRLMGDCGSGKSTVGWAWAAFNRLPVVQVNGDSSFDRAALFGGIRIVNGNTEFVDGIITTAVRNGGLLILDEVNLIDKRIMTALHSLLDSQRQLTIATPQHREVVKAHPNFFIIATGNPDYAGTQKHNEATEDRWVTMQWAYDPAIEKQLIPSKSLRECVIALRERRQASAIDTPVGTRLVLRFVEMVNAVGWDLAREVFLNRFSDDERPVVSQVLETYSTNIKVELGVSLPEVNTAADSTTADDEALAPWEQSTVQL